MNQATPRNLLQQITYSLERSFDIRVDTATPIFRGHLNEKWIMESNRGALFVKSYNRDRYSRYEPQIWEEIELALQLHAALNSKGGACPALLTPDGNLPYIQVTDEGERFVVMELCKGSIVDSSSLNGRQMYSLGAAAAQMHQVWNETDDLWIDGGGRTRDLVPLWQVCRQEMEQTWETRWSRALTTGNGHFQSALLLQKEVIERIHDRDFKDGSPGWTHLDMWTDNLLFHDSSLAAIVDFDRVRYSFPRLDVGRAILSCAWQDGTFREEIAAAFAEGYRCYKELPKGSMLQAVKHIWCVESFWWLHEGMDRSDRVVERFVNEMLWTARQWDTLEDTLGGI